MTSTPAAGDDAHPSPHPPPPPPEEVIREDIRLHGGELYHVVRRALDNDELAKEVVQDVFVRAWRANERYDPERGSRRTWLFAIARNAVVDAVRHRQRRPQAVRELGERDVTSADAGDAVVLKMQLRSAMLQLSQEHRHAIVEVHHRGRPYTDVARELGVPIGTLRSRVYYGLRALRDTLEKEGWTDGRT